MIDIQPQHVTLTQLFQGRLFRIPEYQRSYSWQPKQRQDLFSDITNVYERGPDRSHFMATVVGLRREEKNIGTTAHRFIDVVDGQQRITTLILLLKAIEVDVRDTAPRASKEIAELLIKDDNATLLLLQTNHDSSDYFANYLKNGNHPTSASAETAADRQLLAAIEECEKFSTDWLNSGRELEQLVILIKNRLTFIFHEISDESAVYTVFEVLNSRGLDVSWFDRLKSMLMAIVFEHASNKSELIKTVHSLWTQIYDRIGLRLNLSTESLRFAATLRAPERQSRVMGEADAALSLRDLSQESAEQVIETTRWLKAVTEAVDDVVADHRKDAVTEIVHARIIATAVHLRDDFSRAQRQQILDRWEQVTFRILGMFNKDARWAVGENVRLAWDIANKKLSAEEILDSLAEIGRGFPIDKAVEELRGVDCYNGWRDNLRYFFFKYEEHLSRKAGQNFDNEQWVRIWQATSASSIEHIRPQNWWISRNQEDDVRMHGLGNLTLLSPGSNSRLQDKPAPEKVDDYVNSGLFIAQEVAKAIKESGWNFTTMKERETHLLEWAKQEWGD